MAEYTTDTLIVEVMSKVCTLDVNVSDLRDLVAELPVVLRNERAASTHALARGGPDGRSSSARADSCQRASEAGGNDAATQTDVVHVLEEGEIMETQETERLARELSVSRAARDTLAATVAIQEEQLTQAKNAAAVRDAKVNQLQRTNDMLFTKQKNMQNDLDALKANRTALSEGLTSSRSVMNSLQKQLEEVSRAAQVLLRPAIGHLDPTSGKKGNIVKDLQSLLLENLNQAKSKGHVAKRDKIQHLKSVLGSWSHEIDVASANLSTYLAKIACQAAVADDKAVVGDASHGSVVVSQKPSSLRHGHTAIQTRAGTQMLAQPVLTSNPIGFTAPSNTAKPYLSGSLKGTCQNTVPPNEQVARAPNGVPWHKLRAAQPQPATLPSAAITFQRTGANTMPLGQRQSKMAPKAPEESCPEALVAPSTVKPQPASLPQVTGPEMTSAQTSIASPATPAYSYAPDSTMHVQTQAGVKREAGEDIVTGPRSKKIRLDGGSLSGLRPARTPVCEHCLKYQARCDGGVSCANCLGNRQACVYEACPRGAECLVLGCHYIHEDQWKTKGHAGWNIKNSTAPPYPVAAFASSSSGIAIVKVESAAAPDPGAGDSSMH